MVTNRLLQFGGWGNLTNVPPKPMWRHIPEEGILHCRENLESYI
jgi:hypothetical protein